MLSRPIASGGVGNIFKLTATATKPRSDKVVWLYYHWSRKFKLEFQRGKSMVTWWSKTEFPVEDRNRKFNFSIKIDNEKKHVVWKINGKIEGEDKNMSGFEARDGLEFNAGGHYYRPAEAILSNFSDG